MRGYSSVFFFLRIRRPPRSTRTDTLFPYTRSSDLVTTVAEGLAYRDRIAAAVPPELELTPLIVAYLTDQIGREHVRTTVTNAHIVCRLLLEKKKQALH